MSNSVWRHYALLVLLSIIVPVQGYVFMFHDKASQLGWGTALWVGLLATLTPHSSIVSYLALAPAIAVGTGRLGRRGVRTAAALLGVTLLIMGITDMWIGPAATRAVNAAARSAPAPWPIPFRDTTIYARSDTLGFLRTGFQLLRDQPPELPQKLGASWSQDHPRELATRAAVFGAEFLLPFITIGLVLGAVTWIKHRVVFRTRRDEIVARWFVAWLLAPFAWSVVSTWSRGASYNTLHSRMYWLPIEPYVPFILLAILGWRAAARDSQDAAAWPARAHDADVNTTRA
ncbi:MAG: hypothetical protein ABI625_13905 [bacterium]